MTLREKMLDAAYIQFVCQKKMHALTVGTMGILLCFPTTQEQFCSQAHP